MQDDVETIHRNLEDSEYVISEIEGGFFDNILPFRKAPKVYKRMAAPVSVN